MTPKPNALDATLRKNQPPAYSLDMIFYQRMIVRLAKRLRLIGRGTDWRGTQCDLRETVLNNMTDCGQTRGQYPPPPPWSARSDIDVIR